MGRGLHVALRRGHCFLLQPGRGRGLKEWKLQARPWRPPLKLPWRPRTCRQEGNQDRGPSLSARAPLLAREALGGRLAVEP